MSSTSIDLNTCSIAVNFDCDVLHSFITHFFGRYTAITPKITEGRAAIVLEASEAQKVVETMNQDGVIAPSAASCSQTDGLVAVAPHEPELGAIMSCSSSNASFIFLADQYDAKFGLYSSSTEYRHPHFQIFGLKPVSDGLIADVLFRVVGRDLRAVRCTDQKGGSYANITLGCFMTDKEVASLIQRLYVTDVCFYDDILDDDCEAPSFRLYVEKPDPEHKFYLTHINRCNLSEAELYTAFSKYGTVASVAIGETASVQFKQAPILNITELRRIFQSPELSVDKLLSPDELKSRTLRVTFPAYYADERIKMIIRRHTTLAPRFILDCDDIWSRSVTVTLPTKLQMIVLMADIRYDCLQAMPCRPLIKSETKFYDNLLQLREMTLHADLPDDEFNRRGNFAFNMIREHIENHPDILELVNEIIERGEGTSLDDENIPAEFEDALAILTGRIIELKYHDFESELSSRLDHLIAMVLKSMQDFATDNELSPKELRIRRGNFAYPLIDKFIRENKKARKMVKRIIIRTEKAREIDEESVTTSEDAVQLCTGIIIDRPFDNFKSQLTTNTGELVMNALREIYSDVKMTPLAL